MGHRTQDWHFLRPDQAETKIPHVNGGRWPSCQLGMEMGRNTHKHKITLTLEDSTIKAPVSAFIHIMRIKRHRPKEAPSGMWQPQVCGL